MDRVFVFAKLPLKFKHRLFMTSHSKPWHVTTYPCANIRWIMSAREAPEVKQARHLLICGTHNLQLLLTDFSFILGNAKIVPLRITSIYFLIFRVYFTWNNCFSWHKWWMKCQIVALIFWIAWSASCCFIFWNVTFVSYYYSITSMSYVSLVLPNSCIEWIMQINVCWRYK